jgi:hypothetical protein
MNGRDNSPAAPTALAFKAVNFEMRHEHGLNIASARGEMIVPASGIGRFDSSRRNDQAAILLPVRNSVPHKIRSAQAQRGKFFKEFDASKMTWVVPAATCFQAVRQPPVGELIQRSIATALRCVTEQLFQALTIPRPNTHPSMDAEARDHRARDPVTSRARSIASWLSSRVLK